MSMTMSNKTTLFLLDNVDSFTYNLVDELRALDLEINVYRNTVCADMLFEKMQEQAKQQYGNQQHSSVKEGETVIDKAPRNQRQTKDDEGEYVDFEEIDKP